MRHKRLRDSMEWALMVALVLGAGAIAQAQQKDTPPEGKIVQIGPEDGRSVPADGHTTTVDASPDATLQPTVPHYWLGLLGGPITPELRAHLDIPEDQGVMIRNLVPNSPATEAGLEQYDVLMAANGNPLHDMGDLVSLVSTSGESQTPIELEMIRKGHVETISVTPTERPEQFSPLGQSMMSGQLPGMGMPGQGMPDELLQRFGQHFNFPEGGAMDLQQFGPGAFAGGQSSAAAELPGGVSVSVQRENDQPPHITVKRGDDTWNIVGDDPESLNQLPDDIRPFVEQMLHGSGHFGFRGNALQGALPAMPQIGGPPAVQAEQLRERVEAMERQMLEIQQRLLESTDGATEEEAR
jgi:PDZ domain